MYLDRTSSEQAIGAVEGLGSQLALFLKVIPIAIAIFM
jgi:hypothetical protein